MELSIEPIVAKLGLLTPSAEDGAPAKVTPARRTISRVSTRTASAQHLATSRDCAFRDPAGNLIRIQELR
jgi:hypothetical protein